MAPFPHLARAGSFLREWFAQEQRFFLTGGSALGLFYLDHRRSYDLNLFTTETVEAKEVQNLILRVSEKIEAHWTAVRSAPDFHRFKLARGADREIIDVVVDRAPQVDALKASVDGIRVDTLREVLANKLTTLVSRSELVDAATTDVKKHPRDQFTENLLHRPSNSSWRRPPSDACAPNVSFAAMLGKELEKR